MHEHSVRVTNDRHVALEVTVEPWGGSHWIQPGDSLTVVARGPTKGQLTTDEREGIRSVWAWSGATIHVLRHGRLLEEYVPAAP